MTLDPVPATQAKCLPPVRIQSWLKARVALAAERFNDNAEARTRRTMHSVFIGQTNQLICGVARKNTRWVDRNFRKETIWESKGTKRRTKHACGDPERGNQ